jgi:hypothetical protein
MSVFLISFSSIKFDLKANLQGSYSVTSRVEKEQVLEYKYNKMYV